MKKHKLLGATLAITGLAIASSIAQTHSSTTQTNTTTGYIQSSNVIGTKIKDSRGEDVGEIKDFVLDRNTGCLAYVVLSTGKGGVLSSTKTVAAPWSVFVPSSDTKVYTTRIDREKIYSAPVWESTRIDEYSRTDYINNVYGYYGVSAPRFGGEVSLGTSGTTGVGLSGSTTTTTGSSASTAASATPIGTATPTNLATAAPTATATIRPLGTPITMAPVQPSPRASLSPAIEHRSSIKSDTKTESSSAATTPSADSKKSSIKDKTESATTIKKSSSKDGGKDKTESATTSTSETKSESATDSSSAKSKKSTHHHADEAKPSPAESEAPTEP